MQVEMSKRVSVGSEIENSANNTLKSIQCCDAETFSYNIRTIMLFFKEPY